MGSLIGPFLIAPQVAHAADPTIMHSSTYKAEGSATVTSDITIFAMVNDDTSTATTTLAVQVHYKNALADAWNATTTCESISSTALFRCSMNEAITASGDSPRSFYYYIAAGDGSTTSTMSYSGTLTEAAAEADPFVVTVENAPTWDNAFDGRYSTSTNNQTPGTKDVRCFHLSVLGTIGTSTVYVTNNVENMSALGNAPNTWIGINGQEKFKILSTSTTNIYGGDQLVLTLSGYLDSAYSTDSCVDKFLSGVNIWMPGLGGPNHFATSSAVNTTTTFGTFVLRDVPDGMWDISAYKNGYSPGMMNSMYAYGGSTSTVDVFLPYGEFFGGGDMMGNFVIWSAPMEGSQGSPTDIALAQNSYPMIVAFPSDLDWTTANTTNVELKTVGADGSTTAVAGYSVGYQPVGDNVKNSAGADQGYNFDAYNALLVIYSATALATGTDYIINITDAVKDPSGGPVSGNNPAGGHTIFFSTMGGDFSGQNDAFMTENFGGGGGFMPPFVKNVIPDWGKANVPLNTKIAVEFDQAMEASSINANTIKLYQLDANYNESSLVAMSDYSLDRATSKIAVLTPTANLTVSTNYKIKVLGGVASNSGMKLAPPGMETQMMFMAEFETGTVADTSAPTIRGTSLDRYLASAVYSGVPTSGMFKFSFSKSLDSTTISTNNIYITQKGSTTKLTATASYDVMEGKVLFMPSSALNSTTTYIITLTAYLKDFTKASNRLATTTYEFTTGNIDTVSPMLQYFNADDYTMSITFDEPMNSAGVTNTGQWPSGSTKWRTSVINPANYLVYVDNGPPPSASTALYFGCDNLAGTTSACTSRGTQDLSFTYNATFNSIEVKGLKLSDSEVGLFGANGLRVFVNNVTDLSGNAINTNGSSPPNSFGNNSQGGPFFNSMDTFGMMGPGGGGSFGPPPTAGEFTITDFGGKDPAMMGMMPVGVWPMNMVTGATSIYMVDMPLTTGKAIEAGGKIVLGPFPDESDVSGAKNADPNSTFAHYDINGPGAGKVVLGTAVESSGGLANDGVTVSGQTVTITLGAVATQAPDFLHLELDGIVNPTSPSNGGYKVAIQSQDSDGRVLESFTSMPFFLMPKGKYYIIGHATSTVTPWGLNGVDIFGGSPSTGPLYTTTANNAFGSSTDGEYQIAGLNSGEVMIMTEPYVEVGANERYTNKLILIMIAATSTISVALPGVTCNSSSTINEKAIA